MDFARSRKVSGLFSLADKKRWRCCG